MEEPSKELDLLAHEVIGAAIEVHRLIGPGYLESVYEEALSVELNLRNIPFARQVIIGVKYKDHAVGEEDWIFWSVASSKLNSKPLIR